ncbi:zinc finger BED domain-containing protein RICESLEEPER 2-like [Apium graveolens]|uniref:zinc finger BED domain-containing protein RICESLEEPER 2-like n=1 Tax=Apium graveolens TaxID=4045 RepID=UPI003D799F22
MWVESNDDWIRAMGDKMQLKFDKYWEECNKLLTIAVVLDPRYKMAIVSYAYKGMYELHADYYIDEIREFLVQVFNEYSEKYGADLGPAQKSGHESFGNTSAVGREWLGGFQDFIASSNLRENSKRSELEEYLNEGLFPMEKEVEFDILRWWKLNGPKFPILARMAQDILAIPTSYVASESSFSKFRRIITDTRSSLNDDSVETLMCVKNWLPDFKDGQCGTGKTSEDGGSKMSDLNSDWDDAWHTDF